MKKLFFISITLIFTINLFAQDCNLSPEARKYWITGVTDFDTATRVDDYQVAANDFEKALEYASDCSDIYYNLVKIYGQIGLTKGDNAFQKAKEYLQRYKSLNSTDQNINDLEAELEAMQGKYQRDKAANDQKEQQEAMEAIVGTWYIKNIQGTDVPYITINIDEQGRLWSKVKVASYYRDNNKLEDEKEDYVYWNTDPISLSYTEIIYQANNYGSGYYKEGIWEYTFSFTNNKMKLISKMPRKGMTPLEIEDTLFK